MPTTPLAGPPPVTWWWFDLKTGRRGSQLVTQTLGTVSRIIGEPTELSEFAIRCCNDRATLAEWEAMTLPGRVMLGVLDEHDQPVWGGMVTQRRSTKSDWAQVDLVTLEAYLDRRYVTDLDFTQTSQGEIVSGMIAASVIPFGIQFVVDADSAALRDHTYFADEDQTVLSAVTEMAGLAGGPEVTVDLEWLDADHTTLARIVRVRDRLGTPAPATGPLSWFTLPGCVIDFEHLEDYSPENGANDVMANSSGEGNARPTSEHHVAEDLLAAGWPKFERRYPAGESITEQDDLEAHAAAELAEVKDGLVQLTLETNLGTAPRVGSDWHLGDDVGVSLTCPRFPARVGPDGDVIDGYRKAVRAIGYEINFDDRKLSPKLLEVG